MFTVASAWITCRSHLLRVLLITIMLLGWGNLSLADAAAPYQKNQPHRPVITAENAQQVKQIAMLARGEPVSIALSPDGKTLAASTYSGIWFYDASDLSAVPHLFVEDFHADTGLAFSPDGKILAAMARNMQGGCSNTIQLFDVTNAKVVREITYTCAGHFAFSPDGTLLAYGTGDGIIVLTEVRTGFNKYLRGHRSNVDAFAFSPDGKRLVSGSLDQLKTDNPNRLSSPIRVWNVQTGEQEGILLGHEDIVSDVIFSPNGMFLASASFDSTVRLWDVVRHKQLASFGNVGPIQRIAFSPDGKLLASGAMADKTKLWDVATRKQRGILEGGSAPDLLFSTNGLQLISSSWEHTIRQWDIATGRLISVSEGLVTGFGIGGRGMAFSRDNTSLIVLDGTSIQIWDVVTGKPRLLFSNPRPGFNLFDFDGKKYITNGSWVWEVANKKNQSYLYGFSGFSNDNGTKYLEARDKAVIHWDTQYGLEKIVYLAWKVSRQTYPVGFSADLKILVTNNIAYVDSSSLTHDASLWDTQTGKLLTTLHRSGTIDVLAFSPDGRRLATISRTGFFTSDPSILSIWDVITGEKIVSTTNVDGVIASLMFSPDSRLIVSGANNDTWAIQLWDATTAKQLAKFKGHFLPVRDVVFSADGTMLASIGNDSTLRLWAVN